MKFLLVAFIALAAFVYDGEAARTAKELVTAVSKKCASEHEITPEQMKLSTNQNLPQGDHEKCFLECVYEGVGVVKDHQFNHEGSMKLVALRFKEPKEVEAATHLIDTCNKEIVKNDDETCSLGRVIRECFVTRGKEVDFFPSA